MDAIVCDFTLSGEDGSTFYERLAERSPALAERVLFVTGWSKDAKRSSLLEYTGRPELTKPVDLEELTIAVRRLVGAEERACAKGRLTSRASPCCNVGHVPADLA